MNCIGNVSTAAQFTPIGVLPVAAAREVNAH
jgi:hypothetical protein